MPVHLSLHDTLTELILSAIPSAFGTFLMRQCYLCVPSGLEEAMIIDGAIQRQVYRKIGFPPGTTGMVVIGIVALRDCKMTGSRPVVLAGIVLSTIPALLPLPFRSGIPGRGVPAGGMKG